MKKHLLYVVHTKASWGIYYSEEKELYRYLSDDFDIKIIDWSTFPVDRLNPFSIILFRHPTELYDNLDTFIDWITEANSKVSHLINNINCLRFGLSKEYLLHFQEKGLLVIPSFFCNRDSIKKENLWSDCVIKPLYGESGYGVFRIPKSKLTEDYLQKYQRKYGAFIIQKFLPEVRNGEISVYLIDGDYSHSVLKKPVKNDFIPNWENCESFKPESKLLDLCSRCYDACDIKCDYVRIDWIKENEEYYLSEFEVVDPMFFFSCLGQNEKMKFFAKLKSILKKDE